MKTESRHCYNYWAVIIARENEVLDQSAHTIFDNHQCNFTKMIFITITQITITITITINIIIKIVAKIDKVNMQACRELRSIPSLMMSFCRKRLDLSFTKLLAF